MEYEITTRYAELPVRCPVGDAGTSGRVYVPKGWIGREVDVALVPTPDIEDVTEVAREDVSDG